MNMETYDLAGLAYIRMLESLRDKEDEHTTTLYHGTTKSNIESILTKGLLPKDDNELWLTRDRNVAFMNGGMRKFHEKRRLNDAPAILQVTVPTSELINRGAGDHVVKNSIHPSNIKELPLSDDETEYTNDSIRIINRKKSYGWE